MISDQQPPAVGAEAAAPPRVCAVVIMNHPFPDQLPLLRRIYGERFSAVRFLIPFERLPDEDVITVYRGSYTHSGYINDARRELAAIDCDYYLVLHDDVLLNPQISEASFRSTFPLGPNDGFIAGAGGVGYGIGDWIWYFGMLPKLLYPKSQVFGAGIEPHNLAKYLPDPEPLERKMRDNGFHPTTRVKLDSDYLPDVSRIPSRVLFQGLSGHLLHRDPRQDALDSRALDVEARLVDAMYEYEALYRPERVDAEARDMALPLPMITAGFNTDFYILPRSGLDTFAHYVGVSSAANLFVEIMTPAILIEACERVRTGEELGIDTTGFTQAQNLAWFENPKAFAIHPFKLSRIQDAAHADALIDQLQTLGTGAPDAVEQLAARYFGTPHALVHPGWHAPEHWGIWAGEREVIAPILMPEPGPVELHLLSPVAPLHPRMVVTVDHRGGEALTVVLDVTKGDAVVRLDRVAADGDGIARIRLAVDATICPARVDPQNSADPREIGVGIIRIERV